MRAPGAPVRDWLLVLEIGGRAFRFSSVARVVVAADGAPAEAVGHYAAGLDPDLTVTPGGTDDVAVSIVSRGLHEAVREADAGTGALYLLDSDAGTVEVITAGRVLDPTWGAPLDAVGLTLSREALGATRGGQVPDPVARVDATTWPVSGAAILGNAGLPYPVIVGYPGWTGAGDATPVVVVPLGQLGTTSGTQIVVSEDPDAPITSVRLRNDSADAEYDQDVGWTSDLLGRRVLTADCVAGGAASVPAAATVRLYAGFSPSGGGGVARGMYDVIRYVLDRWAPGSVDWARLAGAAGALEEYQVDTAVWSVVEDPWVLVEAWTAHVNVEVRSSDRGFYLVERRYAHDPRRVVRALVDPARAGRFRRDGAPANQVPVYYRHARDGGGWLAQVIATGALGDVQPAGEALTVDVLEVEAARRSRARYGPIAAERVDLDWTWDSGTAQAVALAVLARTALPAVLVDYDVSPADARGLVEGDEVLLTDDDAGWDARPAILDAPPAVSLDGVRLSLRVPD